MKYPLFKVSMPDSVIPAMTKTLKSGYIAEGKKVKELCELVSSYIHNPLTVMVNSCTSALTMAYALANVGPNTEVITTPLTSIATNLPITMLGGKPVWADVDVKTGLSSLKSIKSLINEKTRAIVALHKDGDIMDMDTLLDIQEKWPQVRIIEDAAHAFGAGYQGDMIGSFGDLTCFSLQAIKHITTGDGGIITCRNEEDYERLHKMKWLGMDRNSKTPTLDDVTEIGFKCNMNDISATIGVEQMKNIQSIVEQHNRNGLLYNKILKKVPGVKLLRRRGGDFNTYWAYTILVNHREDLIKKLAEHDIHAMQIHPRNDAYSVFAGSVRDLPGVDSFSKHELSIPCGWWLTSQDIEYIASVIKEGW